MGQTDTDSLLGEEGFTMARVQLPGLFADRLTGTAFDGPVNLAIDRCSSFYGDATRGLPFFPEFTDHGVTHVQGVLDVTAELLTPKSRELVTAEDIAVLTIAVLLHDSAMHLTPDGFLSLIDPSRPGPLIPTLDPESWSEAWSAFMAEASRWDGRRLHAVLGDISSTAHPDPDDLARYVRSPSEMGSPDHWPVAYCKFIGEFIRRHHPRIAHEFAVQALPAPSSAMPLRLIEIERLDDLAGLIARSHGINLRATFEYLKARFHGIAFCRNTHPVFLMVVLRIADYLQVDSSRAPAHSLRVRSLRNPISAREWSVHLSIEDVMPDENDQEAIVVVARPNDVSTYLRLRSLLNGLQDELDTSWAVLGEVYSRREDLQKLGIPLRRVRSNLDDLRQFRQEVNYIPGRFAFESAGTDLLKKLLSPLYGDGREVGIRELLQNSVDAVNEKNWLQPLAKPCDATDEPAVPEVSVRIEGSAENGGWVTVEDRGIGMTEEVLRSYFLRVGASFRESDAWRRTFASSGRPDIIRSGRFGVGAFAAFLLGERLEVQTRHVNARADEAMAFSASIDDEAIEIKKEHREHPGTTIRVKIDGATFARLCEHHGKEWDWFRWSSPSVQRTINGSPIPSLTRLPLPGAELDLEWHRLSSTAFEDVIWTYGRTPNLVCNGLNVGSLASSLGYHRAMQWEGESNSVDLTIPLKVPCISVTDRWARLPLDLQRFGLLKHGYPFADELFVDVTRDYCAYCLTFAPYEAPWLGHAGAGWQAYPGWTDFAWQMSFRLHTWFYNAEGSGPPHWANLVSYHPSSAMVAIALGQLVPTWVAPVRPDQGLFLGYMDPIVFPTRFPIALANILGREVKNLGPHFFFFTQNKGATILMHPQLARQVEGMSNEQIDLSGLRSAPLIAGGGGDETVGPISVLSDGGISSQAQELPIDLLRPVANGGWVLALLDHPRVEPAPRESAFTRTWGQLMPNPIIPYDAKTRRDRFSEAYRELAPYIEKWERLRDLGPNEIPRRFHRDPRSAERL
jgi:hypothetical protein